MNLFEQVQFEYYKQKSKSLGLETLITEIAKGILSAAENQKTGYIHIINLPKNKIDFIKDCFQQEGFIVRVESKNERQDNLIISGWADNYL